MIVHFTIALRKKLHLDEVTTDPVEAGPHLRWYANLFRVGGVQYILTMNAASLYSVVVYGRGLTDSGLYVRDFVTELREHLEESDMQLIYKRCIAPYTGTITLASAQDRSAMASMNNIVRRCKSILSRDDKSPWDLSEMINATPFKVLDFQTPNEIFSRLPANGDSQ